MSTTEIATLIQEGKTVSFKRLLQADIRLLEKQLTSLIRSAAIA